MGYTMTIYVDKLTDGYVMPYLPASDFSVDRSQSVTDYSSVNASYSVPGTPSPDEFEWKGLWPKRTALWANPKCTVLPLIFKKWVDTKRAERRAFHVLITDESGNTVVSGLYSMTKFSYTPQQSGDVQIQMGFKASPEIKVAKTSSSGSASKDVDKTVDQILSAKGVAAVQQAIKNLSSSKVVSAAKASALATATKKVVDSVSSAAKKSAATKVLKKF